MKKYIIFAMQKPRNYIANFIYNLFLTHNKGVVSYSYRSNVLSGFCKQKGLHLIFINLNNLLMRKPVNNVNSASKVLLITSIIKPLNYLFSNNKIISI